MIPWLCLALLAGAERVDLHLVEAEDLDLSRRQELQAALEAAITTRVGRRVVVRSPATQGSAEADRVLLRAFLGPRHLRVIATRLRPGLPPLAAELDLPPNDVSSAACLPLVLALFPEPPAPVAAQVAAPAASSSAPLWIMGASAGAGLAAVAVAIASTRPIPVLQDRGLLDGPTWSAAGADLDARPIAVGLAIGAGVGLAIGLTLAALDSAN